MTLSLRLCHLYFLLRSESIWH